MVVITKTILKEFYTKNKQSENAINNWYNEISIADWKNFNDIKQTFNSVDYAGNDRYIFDVGGNKYRLVALIIFKVRTVFILFIGTHKEYDKINATTITFQK